MRMGQVVDPVAQRLLELQKVSGTQWLLRIGGAAATVLALLLTIGGTGLFAHFGTMLITFFVALGLLFQLRNPDSDLGLLAPGAIVVGALAMGGGSMLRTAGIGFLLLIAHSAFALAATTPVHGVFGRSAWLLAGKGLLPVLVLSLLGGLLVAGLSGVQLGPWMMVVGVLAAIGLFIAVLPRER
ncbi:hypothetical protein GCM10023160_30310 [Brachybacterium paraconglomeratum]|uniref:hypothetical protein n=1 Tax=Brachybacterium paraconglomeratum TaxID=173362 RepID=UPI0031E72FD6